MSQTITVGSQVCRISSVYQRVHCGWPDRRPKDSKSPETGPLMCGLRKFWLNFAFNISSFLSTMNIWNILLLHGCLSSNWRNIYILCKPLGVFCSPLWMTNVVAVMCFTNLFGIDYYRLFNRWRCISYCEYLYEHFFYFHFYFYFYMFEWCSLLCVVRMGTSTDGRKPFWLPACVLLCE